MCKHIYKLPFGLTFKCNKHDKQDEIIRMLHFFIHTIYVQFGGVKLQQLIDAISQWVQNVLHFSLMCCCTLIRQNSFKSFSRIEINPHM